jgi:hypothetical protein
MFHQNAYLSSATVLTNLNPLPSKADWCRYCIHLSSLYLNYFKRVDTIGIKTHHIAVPFSGTTSIPNFIQIYQSAQKLLGEGSRLIADLTRLLSFLEIRLKTGRFCFCQNQFTNLDNHYWTSAFQLSRLTWPSKLKKVNCLRTVSNYVNVPYKWANFNFLKSH